MKKIYSNSIQGKAPQKYSKQCYHIKLYNYVDDTFALYVRNSERQARELAEEKLMCPQVRSVTISKVFITETILDSITWDLNKKPYHEAL